jgi:hypothetical protein
MGKFNSNGNGNSNDNGNGNGNGPGLKPTLGGEPIQGAKAPC